MTSVDVIALPACIVAGTKRKELGQVTEILRTLISSTVIIIVSTFINQKFVHSSLHD